MDLVDLDLEEVGPVEMDPVAIMETDLAEMETNRIG